MRCALTPDTPPATRQAWAYSLSREGWTFHAQHNTQTLSLCPPLAPRSSAGASFIPSTPMRRVSPYFKTSDHRVQHERFGIAVG